MSYILDALKKSEEERERDRPAAVRARAGMKRAVECDAQQRAEHEEHGDADSEDSGDSEETESQAVQPPAR